MTYIEEKLKRKMRFIKNSKNNVTECIILEENNSTKEKKNTYSHTNTLDDPDPNLLIRREASPTGCLGHHQ